MIDFKLNIGEGNIVIFQVEYRLVGFDLTSNEQLKGYLPIQIMTPVIIDEEDFRVMKIEKRLKTFGLFETGGIKMGIRVNNPELRPGEDLSIKVSSLLRSFGST